MWTLWRGDRVDVRWGRLSLSHCLPCIGVGVQNENLLSSVPVYTPFALVGRGVTVNQAVNPVVNLWICEPSLAEVCVPAPWWRGFPRCRFSIHGMIDGVLRCGGGGCD